MKVSEDVINVLADSLVDEHYLYLPDVQLERKLYMSVNKALEALGGKWQRGPRAHVFKSSPAEKVEQLLQTGEYTDAKKEFQFFETPITLAQELVEMACIEEGETVLEPSAGKGRIAQYVEESCDVIELNEENRAHLKENGFNIVGADFMRFNRKYDVIIANPPFSRQQDIDHVNKMIDLAQRCVVSVMSASVLFRENNKTTEFRDRVERLGGTITPLPDDSFKESGTLVRTCLVKINK